MTTFTAIAVKVVESINAANAVFTTNTAFTTDVIYISTIKFTWDLLK